jgi:hypothetical protein
MAKRKPESRRPRQPLATAPDKAQERLATLRRYYELGRRASGKAADGSAKEPEPLKVLAAEAGVKYADTIRKALRFATTYSQAELEELLALRDPDGEPLPWYFVRILLQVRDKSVRAELQRRAAAEGWSRQDLWDEINARRGGIRRTSKGGRKFALPRNPQQALRRLVERCESWLRFYENMGGEGGLAYQARSASEASRSSAGLRELVGQARSRLREVEEATRKVGDVLQKLESKLKDSGAGGAKPTKAEAAEGGKARGGAPPRPGG